MLDLLLLALVLAPFLFVLLVALAYFFGTRTSVALGVLVVGALALSGCAHLGLPGFGVLPDDRGPLASCIVAEINGRASLEIWKPRQLGACEGEAKITFADCTERWGRDVVLDGHTQDYIEGGARVAFAGLADLVASKSTGTASQWSEALRPSVTAAVAEITEELTAGGDGVVVMPWAAPAVGDCAP